MNDSISRRELLVRGAALALGGTTLARILDAGAPKTPMLVYKDPGCGCCVKWVDLMRTSGFEISTRDTTGMPAIKRRYNVPKALASCHTALVGGYVIEGHVPADLIRKLLAEKPKLTGLTVPGMVAGSPGMEGGQKQAYDVLTFDAAGRTTVYAKR
jgi:hypothetical protein